MIHYFRLSEQNKFSLTDISEFNDHTVPIRIPHAVYDRFRFKDNPFATENMDFLYGVSDDEKYIAQMLTMPMPLSLSGKKIPAYWGQDYFVLPEYRGKGIGKHLADFYLKNNYYIAVGFSPKSAVIHQKMGAKKIGYLDGYRSWKTPVHFVSSYLMKLLKIKPKKIADYHFPLAVSGFKRVETTETLSFLNLNWNPQVVETLRNREYFKWRFFYKPNRYFVYVCETMQNPTYFVVKPCFHKGVNWLMVVDYRFSLQKPERFSMILNAARKLRDQLKLSGILFPSSLELTGQILQKNHFKRYKHEMVLTTYPFDWKINDKANDRFFITFADSDMDMHNYLGRFNFEDQ